MAFSIPCNADLERLKLQFENWCRRNYREDISLLITGKSGVGKSSLVNALVGKKVAEEGRKKSRCTYEVSSYCIKFAKDITVRVYDSPGLQDGTGNERSYLEEIEQKITRKLDLVIFCLKMDDTRFNSDDKKTIQILTDTFGKELWNNAVIALTFANKVEDPAGGDKKAFFLEELEIWREEIYPFFRDSLKIDFELPQSLPIVPTGNYRHPAGLSNCKNWLSNFWLTCYQVARSSAAFNLYRINRVRIRFHECDYLASITGECADESEIESSPSNALTTACSSQACDDFQIPGIELGEEERDSFWKKTWEMFKEHCLKAGVVLGAIGAVGFGVLKLLK